MKKGFSLIELLISLIIISLITATLSPVITKKLNNKTQTYTGSSSANCTKFDNECLVCTNDSCSICSTQLSTPQGYYVDPNDSCALKECPIECSSCNAAGCTSCKEGYGYNNKKCTKCAKGTYSKGGLNSCTACSTGSYANIEGSAFCTSCSTLTEGCKDCDKSTGACNSCASGKSPTDKGECITTTSCLEVLTPKGKICVAMFNAGDEAEGGLSIPDNVGIVIENPDSTAQSVSINPDKRLCYVAMPKGQYGYGYSTANPSDTANGSYSGSRRTVCTWAAAFEICNYHGWRLPKNEELSLFAGYSKGLGDRGLQLCDYSSGYSSSQCSPVGNCRASRYNNCSPNYVWSRDASTTNYHYSYSLTNGVWEQRDRYVTEVFSVRCVKDL